MVERREAWGERVSSSEVGLWKAKGVLKSWRRQQFSSTQRHEALLSQRPAEGLLQAAVHSEKGSREQIGEPAAYSHVQKGQAHLCSCNRRGPGTSGHRLLLPPWHLQPEAKRNINCTFALQVKGVKAHTWSNGVKGCAPQCPTPQQILTATSQ